MKSTVDLRPEASVPVVGKIAWLLGSSMARENDNAAILTALSDGVATLFWWDSSLKQWRGQCFRADHITSSRDVATTNWRTLRDAGWNVGP